MSNAPTSFARKWLAPAILGGTMLAIAAVAGVAASGAGPATVATVAPAAAFPAAAFPGAFPGAFPAALPENGGPGFGGPGFGGPGHGGDVGGGITITAINGNQLSLETVDGWKRTIDATGATVTSGTATIAIGDLEVGDSIRFTQSRNFDGTITITAISVVAPTVDGTITAIDASSLTVRQADGTTKSVVLTATTTYTVNGATSTHDAVVVGNVAHVEGTAASDGTFTATAVSVRPASLGGTVTATTADSITVADASGATATIHVTASTTYRTASGAGKLASVTVGSIVRAEGVKAADGSLNATAVSVGTADGGFGRGGSGGPDHRGGPNGGPHGGGPGGGTPNAPAASPSASPSA